MPKHVNRHHETTPARRRIRRIQAAALLALIVGLGGAAWAVTMTNPAGATIEIVTTEADAGAMLANGAGATLELVSTDQTGPDAVALGGAAWLGFGLLDPVLPESLGAESLWVLY